MRGPVLEVLLLGGRADWQVHHSGVDLAGAYVDGRVNLSFGTITAPCSFEACVFDNPFTIVGANIKALDMTGSRVPGLSAEGVNVTGDVVLCRGFAAHGEVDLSGATIGGGLNCRGGSFSHPDGFALRARGVKVTGDVVLCRGFATHGGFTASGEVDVSNARIGGDLSCAGGSFTNEGGDALAASGIDVTGDVHLGGGFTATGEVDLSTSKIGGVLTCLGGSFTNKGGRALTGIHLLVGLQWRLKTVTVHGQIDVRSASVGLLFDDVEAWPDGWEGDGFTYGDLAGSASVDVERRLAWLGRQSGGFRPGPYTHLAAVYRRRGNPEAARKVLIERERLRTGELSKWRRPFRRLWGTISAYGYQPWRAIALLVALIAAGSIVFEIASMARLGSDERVVFYAPLYAADLAVPFVDLRQAADYQPKERWAQWCMWATITLGWFFSGAFLAAVTGIFKPDE